MKKIVGLFVVLLLIGLCAAALADVEINSTNFPDANFRNFLLSTTQGSDSVLTDAEIDTVKELHIDSKGISDLTGIKLLTNLNVLYCGSNNLREVDVKGLPRFRWLVCTDNQLTSLDLSGCTGLMYLGFDNNFVTSLNISNCKFLRYLSCSGNKLKSVDITGSTYLLKAYHNNTMVEESGGICRYGDFNNYPDPYIYFDKTTLLLTNAITFFANDGSAGEKHQAAADNVETALIANSFTRAGWEFVGWNTKKDGSGVAYTDKASVKLNNEDLDLYAQWKDLTQYTVSFDANGGSGTMAAVSIYTGDQYTLPECGFTAPEGKEFEKWDLGAPGEKITITGDTVVKAQWKNLPIFTVSFDANGGSGTMAAASICKGEQYTLPDCGFTAPEGKEFEKWDQGAPGEKITITGDTVVKAQWKDKVPETWNITFDANGGTGEMPARTVKKGDKFTLPLCSFTAPAGKVFDQWDKGVPGAEIDITADTVITAVWKDNPDPTKTSIADAQITVADQVYTGKALKPELTVKIGDQALVLNTDYTVEWKNNKKVGEATVTLTGTGNYEGTAKATFRINPKAVKSPSVKAGSKKLTVKWKYDKKNDYGGYEIEYSLKKNFKNAKTVTIKKAKTTSTVIKGLKKGKTYYVRIRTWKKVSGKKYYSDWSKTMKKKVK